MLIYRDKKYNTYMMNELIEDQTIDRYRIVYTLIINNKYFMKDMLVNHCETIAIL